MGVEIFNGGNNPPCDGIVKVRNDVRGVKQGDILGLSFTLQLKAQQQMCEMTENIASSESPSRPGRMKWNEEEGERRP